MGKRIERRLDEEEIRIYSGASFGFLQNLLQAFSMLLLAMYFSSLNVSFAIYAFLLSIGDVFSFLLKPVLGYLSDKYGERRFLLIGIFILTLSLFLIGQTKDVLLITIFKIISSVSGALLFILILIYGLRNVSKKPDKKVGIFRSIFSAGWILGLLLPGLIIDEFGMSFTFYLILLIGLFWFVFTEIFTRRIKFKKSIEFKPSFSFIKHVPLPLIYKTIDIAIFNAFIFFFTRYALKDLGLSRSIVSFVVVTEVIAFSLGQFLLSRISNRSRRKYWIPACMFIHTLGISFMILASQLSHYLIASALFGIAGAFVDLWIYSRISERVKRFDKGKVIGTYGWSFDLATILGAQIPVLFSFFEINPFISMFVFPIAGFLTYGLSKSKV